MASEAPHILVEGGAVHRRVNRTLAGLIGFVIGSSLGITAIGLKALSASHDARNASRQALDAAQQAKAATQAVQRSRFQAFIASCEETNERNRATVSAYDHKIRMLSPKLTPAQRAQLAQSRAFTVGLIDALAPIRNCSTYATHILGGKSTVKAGKVSILVGGTTITALRGPPGPRGGRGPQGAPGPAGRIGSRGPSGAQGVQGTQGARGLQGLPGPQGPIGPQATAPEATPPTEIKPKRKHRKGP